MDAREADTWIKAKLEARRIKQSEADKILFGNKGIPRLPMTDIQWRKLKALSKCKFGSNTYAKRFVSDLLDLPYDAPITERQTDYIEELWYRYRRQHKYELAAPRWIYDYYYERNCSTASFYWFTEIGVFDYDDAEQPHQTPEPDTDTEGSFKLMLDDLMEIFR